VAEGTEWVCRARQIGNDRGRVCLLVPTRRQGSHHRCIAPASRIVRGFCLRQTVTVASHRWSPAPTSHTRIARDRFGGSDFFAHFCSISFAAAAATES
jgi:hypothetical protein